MLLPLRKHITTKRRSKNNIIFIKLLCVLILLKEKHCNLPKKISLILFQKNNCAKKNPTFLEKTYLNTEVDLLIENIQLFWPLYVDFIVLMLH